MAEAVVEDSRCQETIKFYCHQCNTEIKPKLPDFVCPECESGFIEEITEDFGRSSPEHEQDPASQFAELWGRAFLESFTNHGSEREDLDDPGEARPFRQTRAYTRRHRQPTATNFRSTVLESLLQNLVGQIAGATQIQGMQGMPGMPINLLQLHGNLGDYALGPGAFDAIISQLLNQLEGTGPPPADKDKIDALTSVKISEKQVSDIVQCPVCMEDFKVNEEAKRLPCDHHYHPDCITQWLELHGTCPVCRKDLNGIDTSSTENFETPMASVSSDDSFPTSSSDSSSSRASGSLDEYD